MMEYLQQHLGSFSPALDSEVWISLFEPEYADDLILN